MSMECRPKKEVILPVFGSVDITRVRPVVDHPLFQKMRQRLQLGEVHVVYPGGRHTRFEHSLGAGKWTWRRARRMVGWEHNLTQEDADALEVYAFLHDIGHGPRSHMIDPLVSVDHDARGVELVKSLAPQIAECGTDPERIVRMMKREDPSAQIVVDKALGTEKIAYLACDAHHTGIEGMPSEGVYLDHVYWLDNKVVADSKILEEVTLLNRFYYTMYARVYYRTAVVASERCLQRMISVLLGQTGDEPEFSEEELVAMTDSELDTHLANSRNPLIQAQYQRYAERLQPYPALAFQLSPFHEDNWSGGHKMLHLEAPEALFNNQQLKNPHVLYQIERKIESALGMPNQSVLAAAPVPARRFEPPVVNFLVNSGVKSLEEMNPALWREQKHEAKRQACFYVCTYLELCPVLATPQAAKQVLDIVLRHIESL